MPTPTSHHLLEPEKPALVALDRLPRTARYRTVYDDDSSGETLHVLYWGGVIVQSMLDREWLILRGPLPTDPTQAESDAAILALQQATAAAATDTAALRQQVLVLVQSTVGLPINATFTNAQLKALLVALLHKAGAINPADMTIRPLADWLR